MRRLLIVLAVMAAGAFAGRGAAAADGIAEARAAMVETIAAIVDDVAVAGDRRAIGPKVLDVMQQVPRHEFVPADVRNAAYADRPLPIGHGQTISQPYIVALMTDLLEVGPDDVVLEIGTGSGYQAAVLAALAREVYTIEIVPPLAENAAEALQQTGYDNVIVRTGDGYYGWPEHAPFDGIVVTAAASHVPPPLVAQLKPGGRMVVPVGAAFTVQHLMLVEKDAAGQVRTELLLPVRFVPLTGAH